LTDDGRPVVRDAPGRVNLIGEHTDYNGGFVLPIATPQRTTVSLAPRPDARAVVHSDRVGAHDETHAFVVGEERPVGRWVDYVQGVTAALRAGGHRIRGFEARITSTVPAGAGLASSAALEIACLRALAAAFGLAIDAMEAARIAHAAETDFVGAPVGVMDQIATSVGTPGMALFLDTRSLELEPIPLPPSVELLVIDSGIPHAHARGEYRVRRAECDAAAARIGVAALRDVDRAALDRAQLPEPLARRARHVVTENERVIAARAALRAGEVAAFGALMDASHRSLRDDFDVSVPHVDCLVGHARSHPDVLGARLTGGGFGGAIVALARAGSAAAAGRRIAAAYAADTGRTPSVLIP
jgi:galactokinase